MSPKFLTSEFPQASLKPLHRDLLDINSFSLSCAGMEGKIMCFLSWPVTVTLQLVCLWRRAFITTLTSLARPLVWQHPSTMRCSSMMMVSFYVFFYYYPFLHTHIHNSSRTVNRSILCLLLNRINLFLFCLSMFCVFILNFFSSFWWKGENITRFVSSSPHAFSLMVYFIHGLDFMLSELWI